MSESELFAAYRNAIGWYSRGVSVFSLDHVETNPDNGAVEAPITEVHP